MRFKAICASLLIVFLFSLSTSYAQKPAKLSMPDSVLLLGTYDELQLVTPDHAEAIKPPIELPANHGTFGYPSISPRGDFVAWTFATHIQKQSAGLRARFALGIYSLAQKNWLTYGDFGEI